MTEEQFKQALSLKEEIKTHEWVIRECEKMERELVAWREREKHCQEKGGTPRPPEIYDSLRSLLMEGCSYPAAVVAKGIENIIDALKKTSEDAIKEYDERMRKI